MGNSLSAPASGPLCLDADQLSKVRPQTVVRYRKALVPFVTWLQNKGISPQGAQQWDDFLVEWKGATKPSKAGFETTVSAFEFFFPRYRGQCRWCKDCIKGRAYAHNPRHTVPLGRKPSNLFACDLANQGLARMAVGVLLQLRRGMRPSEVFFGLLKEDVSFTDLGTDMAQAMLRLSP